MKSGVARFGKRHRCLRNDSQPPCFAAHRASMNTPDASNTGVRISLRPAAFLPITSQFLNRRPRKAQGQAAPRAGHRTMWGFTQMAGLSHE